MGLRRYFSSPDFFRERERLDSDRWFPAEYLDHQQENDSNKTTTEDSSTLYFLFGSLPKVLRYFSGSRQIPRTNGFLKFGLGHDEPGPVNHVEQVSIRMDFIPGIGGDKGLVTSNPESESGPYR